MTTDDLNRSLPSLFSELVFGAPADAAFVLNPGDAGLLKSLDALSAEDASMASHSGGTIAAHVDHLRYGFSLLNQWIQGENPYTNADWTASWKLESVTDSEWKALKEGLRLEVERWHAVLQEPRQVEGAELDGVLSSVMHLAYHLGAIRQIHRQARGPRATEFS